MSSSTLPPGTRVGKYQILSHIATGGMGTVYKARDEELGRNVALKILSPETAKSEILLERFKREARAAGKLIHKNIVTLYEYAEADGFHYLAMELIEGVDLSEYIRRKVQLDPEEARRILIQACKALEHAAEQGIIHRDIKPSNFLLANEEGRCRVKLTDLGLSRMTDEEEFRVTRAGTTVGTVDYMAPEQARDSALADIRSDIYSLGCTFYHMLAGQPPFAEGGIGERVYKHIAADPPDIRQFNPGVPNALWAILRRMLAKNPDSRYQTPAEVIDALRSFSGDVGSGDRDTVVNVSSRSTALQTERTPRPDHPETALPALSPPSVPAVPASPEPGRKEKPARNKRKRQPAIDESTVAEALDPLGVTSEQRQMAASQYNHATEVIRQGGDVEYAIQLLLSSSRLDPANVMYRKMLREVVRDKLGGKGSGWLGSLTNMPAKGRLRAARRVGDHRKVLSDGEELLTRLPRDLQVQLDMANSAADLGLLSLSSWMLEEARAAAPQDLAVLRALAGVYEEDNRPDRAIAVWEQVRKIDPTDRQASDKIQEIAVNQTLSKRNLRN